MKKETILTIVVCVLFFVIGVVGGYAFTSAYRESDCGHCCDVRSHPTGFSGGIHYVADCWSSDNADICKVRTTDSNNITWMIIYDNGSHSGWPIRYAYDLTSNELHIKIEELDDAPYNIRLELHHIISCIEIKR